VLDVLDSSPQPQPSAVPSPGKLVGRRDQRRALERLITSAAAGRGQVLVVRGEPGVGKTALVEHVLAQSEGVRALRAAGAEPERELPFAGLQQLCSPVMSHAQGLPALQREALEIVSGLTNGEAPDRFLVGLAVLGLLSGLGSEQPLVCFVDDAQWLDRASAETLAFVARRLLSGRVAMIFASSKECRALTGLPELVLEGLSDDEARALLCSVTPFALDWEVEDRIIAEARGNPSSLLELPRSLSPGQVAGGYALPRSVAVTRHVEDCFRHRLQQLPADTRGLLIVAAAEPLGNPAVVLRAAETLGFGAAAAAPQEWDGLLKIGAKVVFRHPFVRSSVYHAASMAERRRAHSALAAATDAVSDPDRRAWHLSEASTGPDERVASELERSAGRAQSRGGVAAAAAFLERAALMTADPVPRAQRALAAARAKHLSGEHGTALGMTSVAEAGPLDELQRAQVDLLRAQVAETQRRSSDAAGLLLRAARRLEPLDLRLARDTYLEALSGGLFAWHPSLAGSDLETAQAALRAPQLPGPPTVADLLLDALATARVDGYLAAVPTLKRAVAEAVASAVPGHEQLPWLGAAGQAAMLVWDLSSCDVLSSRHLEISRSTGMLAALPSAFCSRAVACALTGQLSAAAHLADRQRALAEAIGASAPDEWPSLVSALQGTATGEPWAAGVAVPEVTPRYEAGAAAVAAYARAVRDNGLGRYEEALHSASAISAPGADGSVVAGWGLLELIEAASRTSAHERARNALARLTDVARASGTEWALGAEAISRALLSPDSSAETAYREAVQHLSQAPARPHLARAHLLFGEWLRRQSRRADARRELRTALEMLGGMGLEAFAARARRELLATGEKVRKRNVGTCRELTPQEAHIARLALAGGTNAEIGAQLFLSARTVEWHLRKVFTKLGLTSRRQLPAAMGQMELGATTRYMAL